MGAGGRQASSHQESDVRCLSEKSRVPSSTPPFSLRDIRAAIPAHCFQKSTARSLSYLAVDLVIIAALAYAATWIEHPAVPRPLAWLVLWPLYWFWPVCVGYLTQTLRY